MALQTREAVNLFLRQDRNTGYKYAESVAALTALGELIEKTSEKVRGPNGARPAG